MFCCFFFGPMNSSALRKLEATLMAKNRALEDKVTMLRRAGDASAAAAAAAASEAERMKLELAVAEGHIKQLETAMESR